MPAPGLPQVDPDPDPDPSASRTVALNAQPTAAAIADLLTIFLSVSIVLLVLVGRLGPRSR